MEWTFVRAGGFAASLLGWAEQIRGGGVVREGFAGAVWSLIDERDIAAVAVRALAEKGHARQKYVISGPEALTQAEQVRIIGEVLGRPVRFEEISREEMLDQAVAEGILKGYARMAELTSAQKAEMVTDTVQLVTGSPARPFREWVRYHAADFR